MCVFGVQSPSNSGLVQTDNCDLADTALAGGFLADGANASPEAYDFPICRREWRLQAVSDLSYVCCKTVDVPFSTQAAERAIAAGTNLMGGVGRYQLFGHHIQALQMRKRIISDKP